MLSPFCGQVSSRVFIIGIKRGELVLMGKVAISAEIPFPSVL
jgi:hypothetical protein